MNLETSRKRKQEFDAESNTQIRQLKYFVNDNLVNQQNEKKMKEIYSKTINLLYNGAKANKPEQWLDKYERYRDLQLQGNGLILNGKIGEEPQWFTEAPNIECKSCLKKTSRLNIDCTNCNLSLCENCGYSCESCRDLICYNCITIFSSGSIEKPLCQRCGLF